MKRRIIICLFLVVLFIFSIKSINLTKCGYENDGFVPINSGSGTKSYDRIIYFLENKKKKEMMNYEI